MEEKIKFWKLFFFYLLIIEIKSNVENLKKIIEISEEQGYDITNPKDDFFNDICLTFSSENKTDVTLEYRRKYYYYPNNKQTIISDHKLLNEIFSKPKRNNILLCFIYYFNIDTFLDNMIFTLIIIFLFIFQYFLFAFFLFGKYKDASERTSEQYYNYMIKKNLYKREKISDTSRTINNDTENGNKVNFNPLKEEYSNEIIEGNINSENKDVNIYIHNGFISENRENHIEDDEEYKKEELNTTGDFQHSNDEKDEKDEENNNNTNSNTKKIINAEDIYTFGGLNLKKNFDNRNSKEITKEESYEDKKINDVISKKEERMEYVYNRINNHNYIKNNFNKNIIDKKVNIKLTNEELFYSGLSVSILEDKRTFKEIYIDILCHCQIIFYFMPNYYIYEDKRLTVVYYSIKISLYLIIIIIFLNSSWVINQIYNNDFSFIDYFSRCLLATCIVNIISQYLFILTNSKRIFIKYINKMKNSLYGKNRILKYITKDLIDLINNNLFFKILFLFCLNILIFIINFYFSFCFCVAYYNTQFLLIKCLFICIFISQISPFFLALIPAKLRKKAIENNDNKLYILSKLVNSYFLP
jgi:hypothetical protein